VRRPFAKNKGVHPAYLSMMSLWVKKLLIHRGARPNQESMSKLEQELISEIVEAQPLLDLTWRW